MVGSTANAGVVKILGQQKGFGCHSFAEGIGEIF